MRVVRTAKFERMLKRLPASAQEVCREQEAILQKNPRNNRLHLKKLQGTNDTYSFRVARSYRALLIWENNTAWLFAIGNRKDIYR